MSTAYYSSLAPPYCCLQAITVNDGEWEYSDFVDGLLCEGRDVAGEFIIADDSTAFNNDGRVFGTRRLRVDGRCCGSPWGFDWWVDGHYIMSLLYFFHRLQGLLIHR